MPSTPTLGAMIWEAEREIKMRKQVYPRQVDRGNLRRAEAEYFIGMMDEIRKALVWLESINRDELKAYLAGRRLLAQAREAERERIATRLMEEADLVPCKENGEVYRSIAWLVRADFSHEQAERLELAAANIKPESKIDDMPGGTTGDEASADRDRAEQ